MNIPLVDRRRFGRLFIAELEYSESWETQAEPYKIHARLKSFPHKTKLIIRMPETDHQIDFQKYYRERYEVVAAYWYEVGERAEIPRVADPQTCRFCSANAPSASFKNTAHAIPEFLGNRTVFTSNECDKCNFDLAHDYEDHLAKWSHMLRSLMKLKGKKKYPTFKSPSFRIDPENGNLRIEYFDESVKSPDVNAVPFDFHLQGNSESQPYVPIRAAMALIKIAISICPQSILDECEGAINWLNHANSVSIQGMKVMFAFTSGPVSNAASHAILLRRKTDDEIPLLWLVLQCRNFRLQTAVPFCRSDERWWRIGTKSTISDYPYPSIFDERWPFGATEFSRLDWSSNEVQRDTAHASFRFVDLKSEVN